MTSEAIGAERTRSNTASSAYSASEARARRSIRILQAISRNQEKRAAAANQMFRRHVGELAEELARLRAMIGAGTVPPPRKPWWTDVVARIQTTFLMLGAGHGRVGFMTSPAR